MLKRTYFMTVIDGEFCLRMGLYTDPSHVSIVTFECSGIMGTFNTPENVIRDKIGYEIRR